MTWWMGVLLVAAGVCRAEITVDASAETQGDRFDARVETVLPPTVAAAEIRETIRRNLETRIAQIRNSAEYRSATTKLPFTFKAEEIYGERVVELADALYQMLLDSTAVSVEGQSAALSPEHAGLVLDHLGHLSAVLASYPGDPATTDAIMTLIVSAPLGCLGGICAMGGLLISHYVGGPPSLEEHFGAITFGSVAATFAGALGLANSSFGRRVLELETLADGERAKGATRIEALFWRQLEDRLSADARLISLRPTARGSDFKTFFWSRLTPVREIASARCDHWLFAKPEARLPVPRPE